MRRENLIAVGRYGFEVPVSWRTEMRVPARVYADDELRPPMLGGDSMTQLVNVATLPGIVVRVARLRPLGVVGR